MLYRKNLYAAEQIVRLVAGAAMIAGGLLLVTGWLGWVLAASGLFTALTGIFGFCPACAMVGRKPVEKI